MVLSSTTAQNPLINGGVHVSVLSHRVDIRPVMPPSTGSVARGTKDLNF